MNLLESYESWIPMYFGGLGTLNVLLLTAVFWYWYKAYSLSGKLKSISLWTISGCVFLFFAGWLACGIGGQPGFLLSPDTSLHNRDLALNSAMMAMACNIPGWFCMLMAQRKTMILLSKK